MKGRHCEQHWISVMLMLFAIAIENNSKPLVYEPNCETACGPPTTLNTVTKWIIYFTLLPHFLYRPIFSFHEIINFLSSSFACSPSSSLQYFLSLALSFLTLFSPSRALCFILLLFLLFHFQLFLVSFCQIFFSRTLTSTYCTRHFLAFSPVVYFLLCVTKFLFSNIFILSYLHV